MFGPAYFGTSYFGAAYFPPGLQVEIELPPPTYPGSGYSEPRRPEPDREELEKRLKILKDDQEVLEILQIIVMSGMLE